MAQSKRITVLLHVGEHHDDPNYMPESIEIKGERYEDVYGGYMEFFERMAKMGGADVVIENAPCSWLPILGYLRIPVLRPVDVFDYCPNVFAAFEAKSNVLRTADEDGADFRTFIEVMSGFRPECVDALWKIDRQWELHPDRVYQGGFKRDFIVTCNGSFHRPEIRAYEKALAAYTPTKHKVIMLPCAADKPYPSKLHQTVIDLLNELGVRDEWYIANATGVLGVVPEDLWNVMPYYDSGLPDRWNLLTVAREYFTKHPHDAIITYMDFYGQAFEEAVPVTYYGTLHVNAPTFYYDYLDLLDPERLDRLRNFIIASSDKEQN